MYWSVLRKYKINIYRVPTPAGKQEIPENLIIMFTDLEIPGNLKKYMDNWEKRLEFKHFMPSHRKKQNKAATAHVFCAEIPLVHKSWENLLLRSAI